MKFQDSVLAFCREEDLLWPGDRVICALSGGADSVALLWCMYLLRDRLGLELSAAHYNHGLRGPEADRDEAFCRDFCAGYGIPLTVGRGRVIPRGRGLEDAARRARYDFFATLDPTAKIATAHTADDNAETMLLHLLRGSGLRGLGGIAPQRGRVIRPLLGVTREDVTAFLDQWSLPHVEDSSNGQPDFLRNRLRSQVMPVLRRENPRLAKSWQATARSLRQDRDLLEALAGQAMGEVRTPRGLDCRRLLELHPALRRRVLAAFLQEAGVPEPEQVHLAQAEALAKSARPSAWAVFPGGVALGRQYGCLTKLEPKPLPGETALAVPGVTVAGEWEVRCKILPPGDNFENSRFTFTVACDTITKSHLCLRARKTGDRLRLPGGSRSLKRLLIDRKLPAALRDSLPVLAAGDAVLAVGGIGVNLDHAAKPGAPALEIKLIKIESEK